jgi:Uncharacterised nucleotidyltransferase
MSIQLLQTLIRNALEPVDSDWAGQARKQLTSASDRDWQDSLMALLLHRLMPLAFYGLQTHGLTDAVPQSFLAQLQESYRQTRTQNTVLLLTLDGILRTMAARDLHPIFWKGVVLADSFYPDLGTRIMSDIDLEIEVDRQEELGDALKTLGFQCQISSSSGDAFYYTNPLGIALDVHHRNRLFEGKESYNLTLDLQPKQMKAPTFRVLEPNAMLVHLVVHMDGHRDEMGLMLSWLLDIAFVVRKWGDKIDLQFGATDA